MSSVACPGRVRATATPLLAVIAILTLLATLCPQPTLAQETIETSSPRLWIFMGHPGDEKRRERYLQTVQQMRKALTGGLGIADKDIRILFGKGKSAPHRQCDAKNLLRELDDAVRMSRDGRPIWIFFLGHANTIPGGANFNLPGSDVTVQRIAEKLARIERRTPVALWLTTASSGNWVKPLSRRHRCIVAASTPGEKDNETEFPHALATILENPRASDDDRDGMLSVVEIVAAVNAAVATFYWDENLLRTEHAVVETNADGEPSAEPASPDMQGARRFTLRIQ